MTIDRVRHLLKVPANMRTAHGMFRFSDREIAQTFADRATETVSIHLVVNDPKHATTFWVAAPILTEILVAEFGFTY